MKCPRCKINELDGVEVRNALSRRDNKTYICSDCGLGEAMADMAGVPDMYDSWLSDKMANDVICDWFINNATKPAWCCNTHMYDGTGELDGPEPHPPLCPFYYMDLEESGHPDPEWEQEKADEIRQGLKEDGQGNE
jgi:hypothetical protein